MTENRQILAGDIVFYKNDKTKRYRTQDNFNEKGNTRILLVSKEKNRPFTVNKKDLALAA